jgi:glutathione S-transferase
MTAEVTVTAAAPCPVLYSFRRCPYAMRARLALLVSEQVCELREVVLKQKPPELLQASPKATVPVLVLADGQVLDQSLEIMRWALERHDPQDWLLDKGEALNAALNWVARCDTDFKPQLDRYKYPHRFCLDDASPARLSGSVFLNALNIELLKHPHLMGDALSLADVAIAPFVRQFAHTDPAWFAQQPWPALQHWLARFEASDLYAQVMKKMAPWQSSQAPVYFPEDLTAIE